MFFNDRLSTGSLDSKISVSAFVEFNPLMINVVKLPKTLLPFLVQNRSTTPLAPELVCCSLGTGELNTIIMTHTSLPRVSTRLSSQHLLSLAS